jgi:hypothetical protein
MSLFVFQTWEKAEAEVKTVRSEMQSRMKEELFRSKQKEDEYR